MNYNDWLTFLNSAINGLNYVSPDGQDAYNFATVWLDTAIKQNILYDPAWQTVAVYNLAAHFAIVFGSSTNPIIRQLQNDFQLLLSFAHINVSNGASSGGGVVVDQLSLAAQELTKTPFGKVFLATVQPTGSGYRPVL